MGNVLIHKNLPLEKDERGFLELTEFERKVLAAGFDDEDEELMLYVFAGEKAGDCNV